MGRGSRKTPLLITCSLKRLALCDQPPARHQDIPWNGIYCIGEIGEAHKSSFDQFRIHADAECFRFIG